LPDRSVRPRKTSSGPAQSPITAEEQRGTRAQGGAHLRFSDDRDPGHVHSGIDVGGLTFDAGVYAGEQTDGVGVTANLIEVGGDIGSTPTADSHHDASVRVAGSPGAARPPVPRATAGRGLRPALVRVTP